GTSPRRCFEPGPPWRALSLPGERLFGRCKRLMNRQASGDRPVDRCRDAELQTSPNDSPAQGLHLETTAVFEVSGQRRSPLRWQRRGLLDGAIRRVRRKRNPFCEGDGGDLLA